MYSTNIFLNSFFQQNNKITLKVLRRLNNYCDNLQSQCPAACTGITTPKS